MKSAPRIKLNVIPRYGWRILITDAEGNAKVGTVLLDKTEKEAEKILREWKQSFASIRSYTVTLERI